MASPSLRNSGIGHDIEFDRLAALLKLVLDLGLDLVRRAHRHRRLVDDDAIIVHVLADRTSHRQNVLEVG